VRSAAARRRLLSVSRHLGAQPKGTASGAAAVVGAQHAAPQLGNQYVHLGVSSAFLNQASCQRCTLGELRRSIR
jgi:hypothetical protein